MKQEEIDAEIEAEIESNKCVDEYIKKRTSIIIHALNEIDQMIMNYKKECETLGINIENIKIKPKNDWDNYIDKEMKNWKNGNQQNSSCQALGKNIIEERN